MRQLGFPTITGFTLIIKEVRGNTLKMGLNENGLTWYPFLEYSMVKFGLFYFLEFSS